MSCKSDCGNMSMLCVDAQVFVQENMNICYATYIRFDLGGLELVPYNRPNTDIDESTINYETDGNKSLCYRLLFAGIPIGEICFNYIVINGQPQWNCDNILNDIKGYDINVTDDSFREYFQDNNQNSLISENKCFVSLFSTVSKLSVSIDCNTGILTIYLSNLPIGQWEFILGPDGVFDFPQPTAPAITSYNFTVLEGITDSTVKVITNESPSLLGSTEIKTYTHCVADTALCLQLRANKNNFKGRYCCKNDDFPDGFYDICISCKPCMVKGPNEESKWENFHIIRIHKNNDKMKAFWGKHTNKYNEELQDHEDMAILNKISTITICGNIQDVMNNENDMAIYISNIIQSFSIFGYDVDSLFTRRGDDSTTQIDNVSKPWLGRDVSLHNTNKNTYSKLANTKLYLSLKHIDILHFKPCKTNQKNCCKDTLNPYIDNQSKEITKIKKFINKELIHLHSDTFYNHGSTNITICLTKKCITQ